MNMSLDIAWKSLNKKKEELCGSQHFVDADDKDHGYYAEKWRFH